MTVRSPDAGPTSFWWYVFSFRVVMVPLGYWLAVHRTMGAVGLMAAVVAGASVAAVLLGWRFRRVSVRAVRRV